MSTANKRVYTLYRVSTMGQVSEDNDIPVQRRECREFASRQADWKIVKEHQEMGVSGFKVSAKDRDVIQEILQNAMDKKFDVLLVFMFDRLGRKQNETPVIVETFVKLGVEVWSVKEGQQKLEEAEVRKQAAEQQLERIKNTSSSLQEEYSRLISWSDAFRECGMEEKRLIVSNLIDTVTVSKGAEKGEYSIDIQFKVGLQQFLKYRDIQEKESS